jgi:hypothetical protein
MSTQINGNNIQATTRGLVEAWSITEQLNLPNLNQAQVTALGTPAFGTVVYNSTEDAAQIYKQDANQGNPGWTTIGGGGPAVGENSIIRTNGIEITENLTIGAVANGGVEFTNGFSAGEITINSGYTVTIENGASWTLIGDDDLSFAHFVDIESQHITSTGRLHFEETSERIEYYTTSGTVTHSYNNGNSIWIFKNGGGNFTLNLNDVPTDGAHGYGVTVAIYDDGGTGIPSSLNINGQGTNIQWLGGSAPSHDEKWMVVSFAMVRTPNTSQHAFTVFGSGSNYA